MNFVLLKVCFITGVTQGSPLVNSLNNVFLKFMKQSLHKFLFKKSLRKRLKDLSLMYIRIRIHTYLCMYIRVYVCIYVFMYVCVSPNSRYIYVPNSRYIYVCIRIYVCMRLAKLTVYICMYIRMYVHIYIHVTS